MSEEQSLSKLIVFTAIYLNRAGAQQLLAAYFQLTFTQPSLLELLYGNYKAERKAHLPEQVLQETVKNRSICFELLPTTLKTAICM